jgi:hypothetical protein
LTAAQRRERQAAEARGEFRTDARDLDPLGAIGRAVRDMRRPPGDTAFGIVSDTPLTSSRINPRRRLVWPYGLAFDVALAAGALLVTIRRLHTPSRKLPKGQRVA